MTITLPRQNETSLFDGTSQSERDAVDIPASCESYESLWAERVKAAYPGSTISFADGGRVVADGGDNDGIAYGDARWHELTNVEETCQRIGEDLFNDGNEWMVETVNA